jgi:hypothetical protein
LSGPLPAWQHPKLYDIDNDRFVKCDADREAVTAEGETPGVDGTARDCEERL